MSKTAMKLALEALEYIHEGANNQGPHTGISWRCVSNKAEQTITALRKALAEQPAQQEQEPVAWWIPKAEQFCLPSSDGTRPFAKAWEPLYTTPPQRTWVGLTEREVELIDGMIEVQLNHATQCDRIGNRTMAEKQKGWDMERVELLRKLKENT